MLWIILPVLCIVVIVFLGILFSKDIMIDVSQNEEEDVFDDTFISAQKDKSEED